MGASIWLSDINTASIKNLLNKISMAISTMPTEADFSRNNFLFIVIASLSNTRLTLESKWAALLFAAAFNTVTDQIEIIQYQISMSVSYTHLRAHETPEHLVCRLLL